MDIVSIIAYLIAIGVPIFAIYLISLLDIFGTGKGNTVVICLAWGMIGAFGISYFANTATLNFLQTSLDLTRDEAFQRVSSLVAPVVEELAKAVILIYFIQQPRFRYFVDGAVYGFAAGIGFAMSENIFYIMNSGGGELTLAISRVLSAALMHAAASAVVGISFGSSRRQANPAKSIILFVGIIFAIIVHGIYNNVLFVLEHSGPILLIVAIGIGMGGGTLIALFINNGVAAEKKRFEDTLGISAGISAAERKAVQALGSEAIEAILGELALMFGPANADKIRRLLVIQANMGILKNNLKSPASERLKAAWQTDIDVFRAEMDQIREQLGSYIMTLLRSLLDDDTVSWDTFNSLMTQYDPTHVHSFDLFMMASAIAGNKSSDQLEDLAQRMKNVAFMANVDVTDLENLSRAIIIRSYSHGEVLFHQGDEGDALYIIDRGYVDIYFKDRPREILRTLTKGEIVGEFSLLDGRPRSTSVRANGPLRVLVLQRQHFMMFIQSRPRVILAVLQYLAEKLRYTTDAVGDRAENIVATELEEDDYQAHALGVERAPHPSTFMVFGRLAQALNELEGKEPS